MQLRPTMVSDLDFFCNIVNQDRAFCLFLKLYFIENIGHLKLKHLSFLIASVGVQDGDIWR